MILLYSTKFRYLDDSTNLPYRSRSQSTHFQYTFGPEYLKTVLRCNSENYCEVNLLTYLLTTDIMIFTGVMDCSGYQAIMKEYLLPFISRVYHRGHRLVVDNDPKHRSKRIKKCSERHKTCALTVVRRRKCWTWQKP